MEENEKKWLWLWGSWHFFFFSMQTLKKGGGQQDGQKEKEEIHSLQEQLAALKEITVGGAVITQTVITSLLVMAANLYLWLHTELVNFSLPRWSEAQLFTCTEQMWCFISPYDGNFHFHPQLSACVCWSCADISSRDNISLWCLLVLLCLPVKERGDEHTKGQMPKKEAPKVEKESQKADKGIQA